MQKIDDCVHQKGLKQYVAARLLREASYSRADAGVHPFETNLVSHLIGGRIEGEETKYQDLVVYSQAALRSSSGARFRVGLAISPRPYHWHHTCYSWRAT